MSRLWEIDVLRTAAMVLMVVYHTGYDVDMLAPDGTLNPFDGWWRAVQVVCGSTFLTVVGISFWVADARGARQARRALEVLAAAALVSVATLVALGPDDMVRFGILHLIGVATLVLLPLMVHLGRLNLLIGLAMIATGFVLQEIETGVRPLLVFGFETGEEGVDWYPVLPWAGACLCGLAIGSWLYPDGHRADWFARLVPGETRAARLAGAPGRVSLPFYLVHQPVLIGLTFLGLTIAGTPIES